VIISYFFLSANFKLRLNPLDIDKQLESLPECLKESNYLQLQLSERVQLLEAPTKKKRWFGF
jgi:hypothetical protein